MFELARNSGYQSEAAFSKAFRREFGVAPGELRRQALAQRTIPSLLQLEIKKRNPFELPEQEASLNLTKSFEVVRRPFDESPAAAIELRLRRHYLPRAFVPWR